MCEYRDAKKCFIVQSVDMWRRLLLCGGIFLCADIEFIVHGAEKHECIGAKEVDI